MRARRRAIAPAALVALVALGMLLAGCATGAPVDGSPPVAGPSPGPGSTAVFIGDSYTQGQGASSPDARWSTRLAAAEGWHEVNLGRAGTGYVRRRVGVCGLPDCPAYGGVIPDAVLAHPDVVVVAGGQNDHLLPLNPERTAVRRFFRDLRRALPDTRIVAVSPTDPWGLVPFTRELDRVVESEAEHVGAQYVDIVHPDVIQPTLLAPDRVHVGDAGHAAIAERIAAALEER